MVFKLQLHMNDCKIYVKSTPQCMLKFWCNWFFYVFDYAQRASSGWVMCHFRKLGVIKSSARKCGQTIVTYAEGITAPVRPLAVSFVIPILRHLVRSPLVGKDYFLSSRKSFHKPRHANSFFEHAYTFIKYQRRALVKLWAI